MNKNKILIISVAIIAIIFIGIIFVVPKEEKQIDNNIKTEQITNNDSKTLSFLKSVAGIKAENMELIDNPVGVKGEFLIPEKSILDGVNYFLEKTKNDKIENVHINIDKGKLNAKVDYKVTNSIKVPVEVEILPSLNKEKDLVLNIEKVKLLDMKLYDWVVNMSVNSFIKDWFSKDSNVDVKFNDGNVIIAKSNFEGVDLKEITLEEHDLKINMIIDLKYFITD
ncbi:MAG: hypothetical protein RR835_07025 [Peptostreptococcaceae bacterium]